MKHFTLNQIVEVQIRIFYAKNKGFATSSLPNLPKASQVVFVPVSAIKDQFSSNQES